MSSYVISSGQWFGTDAYITQKPTFKSRTEELEWERDNARQRTRELERTLENLRKGPCPYATVIEITNDKCLVLSGDQILECEKPNHLVEHLRLGAYVRMQPQPLQILSVVQKAPARGRLETVQRLLEDDHAEVSVPGGTVCVRYADAPRVGDRVTMDAGVAVITRNFGQPPTALTWTGNTGVDWEDIGGLEEAKRAMREAIEEPALHKEIYARYGKRPSRGILLHGPAGCGKTILCRAAATTLARVHGKENAATGFIYCKGAQILNKFVGESERAVRELFESARKHHREHGYPALVFLDEADAVLGRRGDTRWVGMERTIVPMFLAEMDGLDAHGAIVVMATNRPDTLDPAVLRDGRVDRKIHIRRPTEEEAVDILKKHLRGRPIQGMKLDAFAKRTAAAIFSPAHVLYMIRCNDEDRRFTVANLVSGAMCEGVVERASQHAIRRDIDSGKASGLTIEDVSSALQAIVLEQLGLTHRDELAEFCEPFRAQVVSVDRPAPASTED
jgi:proteasome ATPase